MQSWRKVEALLSSGDLQKRQAGLKEVSAAAGISPSASANQGVASVTQRKAQAKRLLRTMATSDPCWQVREATLDLFGEVASEVNVDFIPAALEAMGDAMWQVRRAALRACSALCACGEAVLTPEDIAEAVEAAEGLVPDWNSFVSLEALGTLERFSELGYRPTSGFEQAFARALHHRDKEVREKAGATLYRSANTSGHEEAAAQAIAELLAYVDLDVKDEACLLLKRLGPTSISVGAVSSRISQGYDEPTRCAALTALAEFAKAGEEHPPGTAVEGDEREKEKESTNEIRKVQERSQWAMKAAHATARLGLQDPAAVVRQEAIGVMGGFGPEAWQQALQTVQGMLEHRSSLEPSCRCAVLQAVANLFATSDAIQSPQGGPAETLGKDDLSAILELIASCFEDPDADVRDVATSVLCGLAMGGKGGGRNRSVQAITVAAQRLGHPEDVTRLAAQTALEQLGGVSGNRKSGSEASGNLYEAARAAAEALSSEEPAIRQGAQRILVNLAGEGPTQRYAAAAFAVSGLKSENPDVLADAADTFVRLGAEGDPDVLEAVGATLTSGSAQSKEVALKILAALSPPGSLSDAVSVEQGEEGGLRLRQRVARCLCDKAQDVRLAAIPAFARLLRAADQATVSQVALNLPSLPSEVRRDCLEALALVWSSPGSASGPEEASAVASCLEDRSLEVRRLAITLLRTCQARGNEDAVLAVASRLRHAQPEVRAAAVEGLAAIACAEGPLDYDRGAVAAAAAHLDSDRWEVRKSAVQAILGLVPVKIHAFLPSLVSVVGVQSDQIWAQQSDVINSMVWQCCSPQDVPSRRIPRLVQYFAECFYKKSLSGK